MLENLKPCPNCESTNLKDLYVYISCNDCLMDGPKSNGGELRYADYLDNEFAHTDWNKLPRRVKR